MKVSRRLLIVEILAFLTFAVLAGVGVLAWRLSQGPIDLEFIRPQVERSLAEARGGQPVRIENLGLEWVRDRGRVEAVARGFTALDPKQNVTFRAERAMISLDAGALLGLEVKARQLRLENGAATVVRSKDGVWTLADMVLAREPDASDKPFDPIRDINWTTLATPIRALISAGAFEQVELSNFRLDVVDQKIGTTWGANPVAGKWSATGEGVSLELGLRLAGAKSGEPNNVKITLVSDGGVTRAAGRLTLEGVDPLSIGRMFGYTGDAFISGKPANAAFFVSATEAAGLQSTRLSLSGVTGAVQAGGETVAVRDLAFDAAYDPKTKLVTLESLKVDSDRVTGAFKGTLDAHGIMTGDRSLPVPFALTSEDAFTLSVTPVFAAPWDLKSATIEGSVSPDARRVTITRLDAAAGPMTAAAQGEVWLEGEGDAMRVGVKGSARSGGTMTPQEILAFWPVALDPYSRNWVATNIPDGKVSKAVFTLDWPPGAADRGFLADENLSLDFEVANGTVKFLPDYPPATEVSGVGKLRGNSLLIEASAGKLGNWSLEQARVVMPRFYPQGAVMDVDVMARGQLPELLRVVDDSSLDIAQRYNLQIDQMRGEGSIILKVQSAMIPDPKPEDMRFSITGGFTGVEAPGLIDDFGLSDANLTLAFTQDAAAISGQGQLGPAPVDFEWREDIQGGAEAAELVARVRATPDLLNTIGLAARNFMQGEANVELRATGPGGREFDAVSASVDLTHAQLEFAEFGWRKPFDAHARGDFRYGKDSKGAIVTGDMRADGVELIAEARLDADSVIQTLDIERLFSRNVVDVRGRATRRTDGGYRIALAGPFFDASPWIDQALDMSGGGGDAEASPAVGGPGEAGPVFDIQLGVDRLRIRPDADLTDAKIAISLDDLGPRSGTATGQISRGKFVNVAFGEKEGARTLSLQADDAGFAARVLTKQDYLIGGKLAIDGAFAGADGDVMIRMSDVRLKDAPLLAQIFSLASLQGLADVLSGDGLLFTDVYVPLKLVDGRIDAPGMRATGPALGITARGWIAPESGELALDGVLAPSLVGVNSLLGALPVIGDLFVSRQGEGMFAPTYSVRGTFAKARVSINPVAAFTPGVLRRIFENPAQPPPAPDAKLEVPAPPVPPVAPAPPPAPGN